MFSWITCTLVLLAKAAPMDSEVSIASINQLSQVADYPDCRFCASWHAEAYFFYLADSYDSGVCRAYNVQCGDGNKVITRPEFAYAFRFLLTEYPSYMYGTCRTDDGYIGMLFNAINTSPEPQT